MTRDHYYYYLKSSNNEKINTTIKIIEFRVNNNKEKISVSKIGFIM